MALIFFDVLFFVEGNREVRHLPGKGIDHFCHDPKVRLFSQVRLFSPDPFKPDFCKTQISYTLDSADS